MFKFWKVALREFNENVQTKSFLIGIFITPVLVILMIVIQTFLFSKKDTRIRNFAIIDQSEKQVIFEPLKSYWASDEIAEVDRKRFQLVDNLNKDIPLDSLLQQLEKDVRNEKLFAWIIIPADIIENNTSISYHAKNVNFEDLKKLIHRAIVNIVRQKRMELREINPEDVTWIRRWVGVEIVRVGKTAKEASATLSRAEQMYNRIAPIAFVYIMFLSIMIVINSLLSSTIEEKNTRIIEVIISTVTPFQFMTGKIVGNALSTLLMLSVWLGSGILALLYYDLHLLIHPTHIILFLIYFLLGFVLISTAISAIGSVCNTLKEAQNLMSPVTIMLVLPLAVMVYIGKNPDSTLAVILSYFPFFTPFLMINRLATTAPPGIWEISLSFVILAVSVWLMLLAAGKIFRVGILMYGKPPTLREMFRMVRVK